MDRLISDEERIRRAEDVLERRRNTDLQKANQLQKLKKCLFKYWCVC